MNKTIRTTIVLLLLASMARADTYKVRLMVSGSMVLVDPVTLKPLTFFDPVTGIPMPNSAFFRCQVAQSNTTGANTGKSVYLDPLWTTSNGRSLFSIGSLTPTSAAVNYYTTFKTAYDIIHVTLTMGVTDPNTGLKRNKLVYKITDYYGATTYLSATALLDENATISIMPQIAPP